MKLWATAILLSAVVFSVGAVDPASELSSAIDPRNDDWQTESLQVEIQAQLDLLAAAISGRSVTPATLGKLALPHVQVAPLRPEESGRVIKVGPAADDAEPILLAEALNRLVAEPQVSWRIGMKITALTWREGPEGRPPETRIRYEAAGRSPRGVVQQTAEWDATWSLDPDRPPLLVSLQSAGFEEIRSRAPMFTDYTGSALTEEASSVAFRFGGEYWHGRIDALGEPNLMGHNGIAVGDVNADGLEDLYVAMGTGLPNRLLVQSEDGTFRDHALEAGVAWLDDTKGVLFADMDNDGDQDLLTALGPTIVLCKNDGAGKFESFVRMRAPTPAAFYSLSVADYDLDGDLDIYGTRYVKLRYGISVPMPFHDANNGPSNHLLRNDGDDRFNDVTLAVGLDENNRRFSLAASWADYDDDGDSDLYVANDFGRNNLYRNDRGRFVDVAAIAGAEDQAAGMGVSWSDYDNDGDLDLYVTNMFSAAGRRIAYQLRFKRDDGRTRRQIQRHSVGNTLLENQGEGVFRDVSEVAGIRMGRWGWGGKFVDLDNDGNDDLVVPNGFLTGAIEDDL